MEIAPDPGMAEASYLQEKSKQAWTELGKNIIDFLQVVLNLVALTANVILTVYRRSERQDREKRQQ